jgi:ABC-2 type transport system permease protein
MGAANMISHTMLFQSLRWRLFCNSLSLVLGQSWLRPATIAYCCVIIWGLLFGLSWYGFYEIKTKQGFPLESPLIESVFALFFFTMTILLIFSSGIILYSGLFSGNESQFLLATPMPDDQIFAYKFQGAIAFSSWAFVLLGSPILLAYGLEVRDGAPWYYYVVLPIFFLGFLLIPGSIGAFVCLLVVNILPRHRKHILIGLALLVVAGLITWAVTWYRESRELGFGSRTWFESLLNQMSILSGRLVPFQWIAGGIKSAAMRKPEQMAYYLGLVWSNGLFCYLVSVFAARHLYRRGYNRIASGGSLRRRYGGHWLDRVISRVLFPLDAQTLLLIVKDFRTFRRDPAQWFQIIIFLGIGSSYFGVVRLYYEEDVARHFKNAISLLTLTATSFLMCAYTGRFIFPMLSLEGNKFWILGLLPLDRSRLMMGKFVFASIGCVTVGEGLVLFSNLMLGTPWLIIVMHMATIGVLALAFSGMSVGLGACMPNFRESDPSKIAVGFGGTVNLVVSLMMLGLVVAMMAAPITVFYGRNPVGQIHIPSVPWPIWVLFAAGFATGLCAIWMPMRAGMKHLRGMEF